MLSISWWFGRFHNASHATRGERLVAVADALDCRHQVLSDLRALVSADVDTRARDEDRGYSPHLVDLRQGPTLNVLEDRRGDESPDDAQLGELELRLVAQVALRCGMPDRWECVFCLVNLQEKVELGSLLGIEGYGSR